MPRIANSNKIAHISESDATKYVLDRFMKTKKTINVNNLIKFHTNNKYFLMAHSQMYLKLLGNIVANHEKKSINEILEEYEENLKNALNQKPTTKSNINVLMDIFGGFSKLFTVEEKDLYLYLVNLYKHEQNTLGKTLSEIEPLVYRFNNTYLASQSYFQLYSDIKKGRLFSILSGIN